MIAPQIDSLPLALSLLVLIANVVLIEADNGGSRRRIRWRVRLGRGRRQRPAAAVRRALRRSLTVFRRRRLR
jgi:hypothetical protein